jgi:hypothetical protein
MGFFLPVNAQVSMNFFHRNEIAINFRCIMQSNFDILTSELNFSPDFKLFRPKKSQNRTKIGENRQFFSFCQVFNLADLEIYGASATDAFKFLSLRVKYFSF